MSITVVADTREKKIIPTVRATLELAASRGLDVKLVVKQVNTGDFSIIYRNKVCVVLERKTWADLSSTIMDEKRSLNVRDLVKIRAKLGTRVSYVVEGATPRKAGTKHMLPRETMINKLYDNALEYGVHPLFTKSMQETADLIVRLCERTIYLAAEGRLPILNTPVADTSTTGGDPKTEGSTPSAPISADRAAAQDAVKQLMDKHKNAPIDEAVIVWRGIPGVGPKIARTLAPLYSLAEFIVKTPAAEVLGNIKKANGRRIGDSNAKKIIAGIATSNVGIKVLEKIKGISKKTATEIIKRRRLFFICKDALSGDSAYLSNIKINKRKVGKKAHKIFDALLLKPTIPRICATTAPTSFRLPINADSLGLKPAEHAEEKDEEKKDALFKLKSFGKFLPTQTSEELEKSKNKIPFKLKSFGKFLPTQTPAEPIEEKETKLEGVENTTLNESDFDGLDELDKLGL